MRGLVAVVLAAGEGKRLRPLTKLRPKPLCPINNRPLIDLAIERVGRHCRDVAVNSHYLSDQIVSHLHGSAVTVSVEQPEALGTAGAIGALKEWIDGRDVLIVNADTWMTDRLDNLVRGWDGLQPRLLVQKISNGSADFGDLRFAGASLLPGNMAAQLPAQPLGLYEAVWRQEYQRDALEFVPSSGPVIDCGTPREYLQANLLANKGESVIGRNCIVAGRLIRSVVWDYCTVAENETLTEVIRATDTMTVMASA